MQPAEIRQSHIVAKEVTQMGIGIARHGKVAVLKLMGCQGENLIKIARVVERDAHAGS